MRNQKKNVRNLLVDSFILSFAYMKGFLQKKIDVFGRHSSNWCTNYKGTFLGNKFNEIIAQMCDNNIL